MAVTVRMWLSQLQSPVRRHVEALAAPRNDAWTFSEDPVQLKEWGLQTNVIFGNQRAVAIGVA